MQYTARIKTKARQADCLQPNNFLKNDFFDSLASLTSLGSTADLNSLVVHFVNLVSSANLCLINRLLII